MTWPRPHVQHHLAGCCDDDVDTAEPSVREIQQGGAALSERGGGNGNLVKQVFIRLVWHEKETESLKHLCFSVSDTVSLHAGRDTPADGHVTVM